MWSCRRFDHEDNVISEEDLTMSAALDEMRATFSLGAVYSCDAWSTPFPTRSMPDQLNGSRTGGRVPE